MEIDISKETQLFNFEVKNNEDLLDSRNPLEDRIYRILTRSGFRIGSIDDEVSEMLRKKINLSIKQNKPIALILLTGWGKNWKSPFAPGIDWAEYFHFKFLYNALSPICLIYKPGVVIEHSPDDYAVKIINSYKQKWLDTYDKELVILREFLNIQTPDNFKYTLKKSSDWYEYELLEKEVHEVADRYQEDIELKNKLVKERFANAVNNVVLPNGICEKEIVTLQERSVLLHKAWLDVDYKYRKEYVEGGFHIPIIYRKGVPNTYPIKNAEKSIVQFWKGVGVLEKSNDRYRGNIISPNKYKQITNRLEVLKVKNNPIKIQAFSVIPISRD